MVAIQVTESWPYSHEPGCRHRGRPSPVMSPVMSRDSDSALAREAGNVSTWSSRHTRMHILPRLLYSRLLYTRAMFFHRLRHQPPISDICCNFLVRLQLRRDHFNDLLSQVLRDTYDTVQIADKDVAGMYHSVLVIAVETDWFIDRGDSHCLRGCRGADVSGEDLRKVRFIC